MIKSIYIKNFVIIRESEINFSNGLNIITGETGSGKSLIFKAINLLMGERAIGDLIFSGESKSIIEAVFDTPKVQFTESLTEFIGESQEIIIRRELSKSGQSRSFINDSQVGLSELKTLRNNLLDYHGQHSTTRILDSEYQLEIIDKFGVNQKTIEHYKSQYNDTKNLQSELRKFENKKKELLQNLDYWKFKLNEIMEVNPKEAEDEEIKSELNLIENSEMLFSLSGESSEILYNSSKSAFQKINESIKIFEELSKFDPEFENFIEDLNSANIAIQEAGRYASGLKDRIDFDPIRIEELRERYSKIRSLTRKFGEIDEILKEKEALEQNINSAENFDEIIDELKKQIEEAKKALHDFGKILSKERMKSIQGFTNQIVNEFKKLGLENADFEVYLSSISNGIKLSDRIFANESGLESLEFQISTNKGRKFSSLANSVSGGEMSRIMLAIKKILRDKEEIDLLLLDEIDTGISGKTAALLAKYIKNMAGDVQLLSITHQPQIAATANNHIYIYKENIDGISESKSKVLTSKDSVREIAKLFSGEIVSEESIKSAEKLLEI